MIGMSSLDHVALADLLFPDVSDDIAGLRDRYPARPEGQVVTRVAPSPTGLLHLGTLYSAFVPRLFAQQQDGVFILRIEDTDQERKLDGGVELIIQWLHDFGLNPHEGRVAEGEDLGNYSPYQQSERLDLYRMMIKYLIRQGHAYPCWMTTDELDEMRQGQMLAKQPPGVYGSFSVWGEASLDQIQERVTSGDPYVIRLRAPYTHGERRTFPDLLRGDVTTQAPFVDMVLLKSDGFPTYHLAHLVDDRLMGTTHVIRGDERLASVPLHTILFELAGLQPPAFAHLAPMLKTDEGKKRKLSKRKDPEADVRGLLAQWFAPGGILSYLMTILSPDYEIRQWEHQDKSYIDFDLAIDKLNNSGALVDMDKMQQVNREYLARLSLDDLYDQALERSGHYDNKLHALLVWWGDYIKQALNIERHTEKDPKRYVLYGDIYEQLCFFDDTVRKDRVELGIERPTDFDQATIRDLFVAYADRIDLSLSVDERFADLKDFGSQHWFAVNNAQFKEWWYIGKVGNLAMLLRLALTWVAHTPDLYAMMQIMDRERVSQRLKTILS
jgi:glutamyl-tRNA synthetase